MTASALFESPDDAVVDVRVGGLAQQVAAEQQARADLALVQEARPASSAGEAGLRRGP